MIRETGLLPPMLLSLLPNAWLLMPPWTRLLVTPPTLSMVIFKQLFFFFFDRWIKFFFFPENFDFTHQDQCIFWRSYYILLLSKPVFLALAFTWIIILVIVVRKSIVDCCFAAHFGLYVITYKVLCSKFSLTKHTIHLLWFLLLVYDIFL